MHNVGIRQPVGIVNYLWRQEKRREIRSLVLCITSTGKPDVALQQQNAFPTRFFRSYYRAVNARRSAMGLTHSLNVLMISAAFLFVATMLFI
jgi:hypothetical protein